MFIINLDKKGLSGYRKQCLFIYFAIVASPIKEIKERKSIQVHRDNPPPSRIFLSWCTMEVWEKKVEASTQNWDRVNASKLENEKRP